MKITVQRAAELIGKSQSFVRIGLQRKLLDIGVAYKLSGQRWTYSISPGKLASWLGITETDLQNRLVQ